MPCHNSVPPPGYVSEPALDRGEPGGSLAREYERRKSSREQRVRQAHPRLGGLILALGDAPQHETAFHQGDLGEKAVAASLEKRTGDSSVIKLYNRRMPGGRGDIDLIAIARSGVFVIDAKDWTGQIRIESPLFGDPKLLVNGRDRTKAIDGLERQLSEVRAALNAGGHADVALHGRICLTRADLPWLLTQRFRGHRLLYRKALAKELNAVGPLGAQAIDQIAHQLGSAFPPA